MKIILKDIDHILFPEFYGYRKDRFKKQQEYLKQIDIDNYQDGIRNIKFVVKITNLSHTIKDIMTREFLRSLYEQLIDISFDWHKPYDWHELKPILLFFTIFSDARSIRDLEKIVKKPNTHRMMDKYMIIPKVDLAGASL